jgi:hypothetical protein
MVERKSIGFILFYAAVPNGIYGEKQQRQAV